MNGSIDPHRELTDDEQELVTRCVAGDLEGSARTSLERRALGDPALADALYAHGQLADATAASMAFEAAPRPARPRARPALATLFWRPAVALPIAAALAAAIGYAGWMTLSERAAPGRFRSGAEDAALIEPVGRVAAPPATFRWTRVGSATLYRFELVDEETGGRFQALVADTVLDLATLAGAPRPAARGTWKVIPIEATGMELPPVGPARFAVPGPRETK